MAASIKEPLPPSRLKIQFSRRKCKRWKHTSLSPGCHKPSISQGRLFIWINHLSKRWGGQQKTLSAPGNL